MDENEMREWVRTQFQRANKYLAEQGVLFKSVVTEESRYLAPYVAVWKIVSQDNKRYWVITGDVPADVLAEKSAPTARDAIRYFSYQWQLKAENIEAEGNLDETKAKYIELLRIKGAMLYDITMKEEFWPSV